MSLSTIEYKLKTVYERCASQRTGQPVFGLEHGLSADEFAYVKAAIGNYLRSNSLRGALPTFPLCIVACSSEVGYDYLGTGTDFWPKFEDEIGAELDEAGRKSHTRAFEFAHKSFGLKAPAETPWTRNFRHIAWPVANAIASREVHRTLAIALRKTMTSALFDSSVDTLVARLRIEARSQQNTRLMEWLAATDVASALVARLLGLQPKNSAIHVSSLDRIIEDLDADPIAKQAISYASATFRGLRRRKERPKFRLALRLSDKEEPNFSLRVPALDGHSLTLFENELGRSRGVISLSPSGMELRFPDLVAGQDLAISSQMVHEIMSGEVTESVDEETSSLALRQRINDLMPVASYSLIFVEETRNGSFVDWPVARKIPHSRRILVATLISPPSLEGLDLVFDWGKLKLFEVDATSSDGRAFLEKANFFVDQSPNFKLIGGIQLGEGIRGPYFAPNMPVALTRCGPNFDGPWSIRSMESGEISLSSNEIAVVLDGSQEKEVLEVRTDAGVSALEVQFNAPENAASRLAIKLEPLSPSVEDIERGRVQLTIDSPLELNSVPLKASIHNGVEVIASSSCILKMIPANHAETSRVTSELSQKLADASPPRSSHLFLEVSLEGIWKYRQLLKWDPVPVDWHIVGDAWQATSGMDEIKLYHSTMEDPLTLNLNDKPIGRESVFRLFVPVSEEDIIFLGALVDGPRKVDPRILDPRLPSEVSRILAGSSTAAGFKEVLEGFLLWSTARPTHWLAALGARKVADAIETKIVRILCGMEWTKAESRSQLAAGSLQRVLATQAFESGMLTEDEIPVIPERLRRIFLDVFSSKIEVAWPTLSRHPEQIDFDQFADQMAEAAADAYEEIASHFDGPEVEDFENAYPYSEPALWRAAHRISVERMSGARMSRLILPSERGRQLQDWDYSQTSTKLISMLSELHTDRSARGQSKWIDEPTLQAGLQLWLQPSGLLKTANWFESISRFLQDRPTARAVRYAALRYTAASSLVQNNDG